MLKTNASKRITLLEKQDYIVDLEYGNMDGREYAILHLPSVEKFTKSVYQDMLVTVQQIWEFLSDIHYKEMFIAVDQNDPVINKFAGRLGFIHLGNDQGMAVYQYKEFV